MKDFLAPLGTLLGAALGFAGAVMGARMAARAQEKRASQDAETKRQEDEKARAFTRLEAFADQAGSLIGDVALLANARAEARSDTTTAGEEVRLRAAQMLGASHLLDADLDKSVREFIGAALEVSQAPTAAQTRQSAQRCGATYEALMQAIGTKLRSAKSTVGAQA